MVALVVLVALVGLAGASDPPAPLHHWALGARAAGAASHVVAFEAEAVTDSTVHDALAESDRPSMVPPRSPHGTPCHKDIEGDCMGEVMSLSDVYGEAADDLFTGGVRGVSIRAAPGGPSTPTSLALVPSQATITERCAKPGAPRNTTAGEAPPHELPPCPRRVPLRGEVTKPPLPEYLMYPEPPREPWSGPRSDREPCPAPRVREERFE